MTILCDAPLMYSILKQSSQQHDYDAGQPAQKLLILTMYFSVHMRYILYIHPSMSPCHVGRIGNHLDISMHVWMWMEGRKDGRMEVCVLSSKFYECSCAIRNLTLIVLLVFMD
jgi:hypothetical protein